MIFAPSIHEYLKLASAEGIVLSREKTESILASGLCGYATQANLSY